jgi:hypothetical protein
MGTNGYCQGGFPMQRTLLALALITTASVSYAQTMQPQANDARDAYGQPVIGRNDWVRQPGDEPGPRGGGGAAMNPGMTYSGNPSMASAPADVPMQVPHGGKLSTGHAMGPEPMPTDRGPHQVAFRDEYGFRYDSEGNRLDGRGYVVSPHIPSQ